MFIQVVGQIKHTGDEQHQQYTEDTGGDPDRLYGLVYKSCMRRTPPCTNDFPGGNAFAYFGNSNVTWNLSPQSGPPFGAST